MIFPPCNKLQAHLAALRVQLTDSRIWTLRRPYSRKLFVLFYSRGKANMKNDIDTCIEKENIKTLVLVFGTSVFLTLIRFLKSAKFNAANRQTLQVVREMAAFKISNSIRLFFVKLKQNYKTLTKTIKVSFIYRKLRFLLNARRLQLRSFARLCQGLKLFLKK